MESILTEPAVDRQPSETVLAWVRGQAAIRGAALADVIVAASLFAFTLLIRIPFRTSMLTVLALSHSTAPPQIRS